MQQFDMVCYFLKKDFLDLTDFVTSLHVTFGRKSAQLRESVKQGCARLMRRESTLTRL